MSEPPWPDNLYRPRPPGPSRSGRQDAYALPDSGQRDRSAGGQEDWAAGGNPPEGSEPRGPGVSPRTHRADARADRHQQPPSPGVRLRLWGTMRGRAGVVLVVGSAALGALLTAVTRSQPGFVLGLLVVAGTVVAALAVQPRAAHVIIPVPALAYLVAAVLAGMVSDQAVNSSGTALAINAAQWVASGFIAMTLATGLAIVIAVSRRVRLSLIGNERQRNGSGEKRTRRGTGMTGKQRGDQ